MLASENVIVPASVLAIVVVAVMLMLVELRLELELLAAAEPVAAFVVNDLLGKDLSVDAEVIEFVLLV